MTPYKRGNILLIFCKKTAKEVEFLGRYLKNRKSAKKYANRIDKINKIEYNICINKDKFCFLFNIYGFLFICEVAKAKVFIDGRVRLLPALNIPFDILKQAVRIILEACTE